MTVWDADLDRVERDREREDGLRYEDWWDSRSRPDEDDDLEED